MIKIGPTFAAELTQAGILDKRFSWGADGSLEFHPEMPEADKQKVLDVFAAHDPIKSEADWLAAKRVAELKTEARDALLDALLEAELLKPDALAAVKTWDTERRRLPET